MVIYPKSNKILTTIQYCILDPDDFGRVLDLSPEEMEPIVGLKPVFMHSQEDIKKMTKDEYKAVFTVWETEKAEWELSAYEKFHKWNFDCLYEMEEDELEHLGWLCERIFKDKVRNMDMESTAAFHTAGLYFDKNKHMVIYNRR